MKLSKLLMIATAGMLAYKFYKEKYATDGPKKPGIFSNLISGLKESVVKPLEDVADDLPSRSYSSVDQ